MDDAMLGLMAEDPRLAQRLQAFAAGRLSPDETATSRTRAKVMAMAHRRAALADADASLRLVGRDALPAGRSTAPTRARYGSITRRVAMIGLAAGLTVGAGVGTTFAAAPGGALYGTRLWIEAAALPTEPVTRVSAELRRLHERLGEFAKASADHDVQAATAALDAYAAIVDLAWADVLVSADSAAATALEGGVRKDLGVLRALADGSSSTSAIALQRAIERTLARSTDTLDSIGRGRGQPGAPDGPSHGGTGPIDGGPSGRPTAATGSPAVTAKPTKTGKPGTPSKPPKASDEPTKQPATTIVPTSSARPTRTARPDPTNEPPGGAASATPSARSRPGPKG